MNPHHLSASDLLIWGIVAHLVADWPLQNDWMANNKQRLRHPAGYIHAGIHWFLLMQVFGWAAIYLAVAHFLIDTRKPVEWWSKLVRQTQPANGYLTLPRSRGNIEPARVPLWDAGTEVRFWTDQVFHIICIAVAALLFA